MSKKQNRTQKIQLAELNGKFYILEDGNPMRFIKDGVEDYFTAFDDKNEAKKSFDSIKGTKKEIEVYEVKGEPKKYDILEESTMDIVEVYMEDNPNLYEVVK